MLWLLYRGAERVSLAVPESLDEHLDGGEQADVFGLPLDRALRLARTFVSGHSGWVAVFSVPHELRDLDEESVGSHRQLGDDEVGDVVDLGMQLPLGEWADALKTRLYELSLETPR